MKRLGDSDRSDLCPDRLRQREPLLDGLFREPRAVRRNQNVLVHVLLLSADGREAMLIFALVYHPLMEAMSITGANLSARNRDDKISFPRRREKEEPCYTNLRMCSTCSRRSMTRGSSSWGTSVMSGKLRISVTRTPLPPLPVFRKRRKLHQVLLRLDCGR